MKAVAHFGDVEHVDVICRFNLVLVGNDNDRLLLELSDGVRATKCSSIAFGQRHEDETMLPMLHSMPRKGGYGCEGQICCYARRGVGGGRREMAGSWVRGLRCSM
jgi:hypothetical protein